MEKSAFTLWSIRESINKSKTKNKRPEIEQLESMRKSLYPYWHEIEDFARSDCYQVAMKVALLRNATDVSEVAGVLQELKEACEESQERVKFLIKEHETFMQDYGNQSASEFQSECRDLGGQLRELNALIIEELDRCRKFNTSTAKALENAKEIGKNWYKESRKVRETAAGISKHLDNINMTMSSNAQYSANPKPNNSRRRCVIV